MEPQKVLIDLGYKPHEAEVYLAVLEGRESTVSAVASSVGLPRTSVQLMLEKLKADGLLGSYTRKRYTYWMAENPNKLLTRLKEKEAAVISILPELQALRPDKDGKPVVRVYSGKEEIKNIHDDILETKHHILGIIPWDDWIRLFGREYVDDFIKRRNLRFLQMRLIAPKTATSKSLKSKDAKELRTTRFLPERIDIHDTIFIYGHKVAIVSLNKKFPTGIVIDDPDTEHTMTVFFEETWRQSTTE